MEKAKDILEKIWGKAHNPNHDQWKVVAMCIIAATTFWFFSALNKPDYTTTIDYPISFKYEGEDSLIVVGDIPDALRINVTGGGWGLLRKSLGFGTKPLEVRLNNPTEVKYLLGSTLAPLIVDQVNAFSLNSVITDTLRLNIEYKQQRTLRVSLDRTKLDLAMDHVLVGEIMLHPDTINVTGPTSLVEGLPDTLFVEVTESNIEKDFQKSSSIDLDIKGLRWVPNQVEIAFKVEPLVDETQRINLTKKNFPKGYTLQKQSDKIDVQYQVASSYRNSVDSLDIQVIVDFSKLSDDSTLKPVAQTKNPYITMLQVDSTVLKVIHAK